MPRKKTEEANVIIPEISPNTQTDPEMEEFLG
jgi:hypothetical protein